MSQDSWGINPLCNTIIGFKNYFSFATRSRYISFSLANQPDMALLLLSFARKKNITQLPNQFPQHLFEQLETFGFLINYSRLRGWSWIRHRFNFLNENRNVKFNYHGRVLAITSFVFMAFNSQKNGRYIKETVLLPFWAKEFSYLVYQLVNGKLDPSIFFNPKTKRRLLKHGVLGNIEYLPKIDSFFSRECILSNQLIDQIPQSYRSNLPSTLTGKLGMTINPRLYTCGSSSLPETVLQKIAQLDWIKKAKPNLFIEHPVSGVLSVYWLDDLQYTKACQLKLGTLKPDELDDDTFRLFNCVFLIYSKKQLEQFEEKMTLFKQAVAEGYSRQAIIFQQILPPLELVMARKYVRFLDKNRFLMLDKANGGTKKRYWVHRDAFTFHIQHQLATLLNQFLTNAIKPGHNALTVYKKGAVLPVHKDDVLAFSWVLSLPLEAMPEEQEPWPLYTESDPEKPIKALLQPGDALLVNPQLPHWRDEFTDEALHILFLWFTETDFVGYVNGNWIV